MFKIQPERSCSSLDCRRRRNIRHSVVKSWPWSKYKRVLRRRVMTSGDGRKAVGIELLKSGKRRFHLTFAVIWVWRTLCSRGKWRRTYGNTITLILVGISSGRRSSLWRVCVARAVLSIVKVRRRRFPRHPRSVRR